MFDDAGSMIEPQRVTACIWLDSLHRESYRVGRLLEAVGGRCVASSEGMIYRFISGVARDDALDLVRSRFGWTVATAFDRRPWLPS